MTGTELKELRLSLDLTQEQLANKIGYTKRAVQNWEAGNNKMSPGVSTLVKALAKGTKGEILSQLDKNHDGKGIPVYPGVFTTAGNAGIFRDLHDETPLFYIDAKDIEDCDYGVRVTGDSMYSLIKHGDYAACKTILNMNVILYGEKYHVVTRDYSTIKYIWPHPTDQDYLMLVAHNKTVPDTPMPKAEIIRIGLVKAWVAL